MPDAGERRRLFEGVAYDCQVGRLFRGRGVRVPVSDRFVPFCCLVAISFCLSSSAQMSAQPEEAVELYLAADRPVAALALINGQMSAAIAAAAEEEGGAQPALGESVTVAPMRTSPHLLPCTHPRTRCWLYACCRQQAAVPYMLASHNDTERFLLRLLLFIPVLTHPPSCAPSPPGASSASERLRRIALRGAEAAARLSAAAGSSIPTSSSAAAAAASLPLSPLSLSLSSAPLAADPAARRELEAFQQLGVVRDMLLAAKRGRHDQVREGYCRWGRGGADRACV